MSVKPALDEIPTVKKRVQKHKRDETYAGLLSTIKNGHLLLIALSVVLLLLNILAVRFRRSHPPFNRLGSLVASRSCTWLARRPSLLLSCDPASIPCRTGQHPLLDPPASLVGSASIPFFGDPPASRVGSASIPCWIHQHPLLDRQHPIGW
jgi:hypothetical protein